MSCGEVLTSIWSMFASISYFEWFKVAAGAWPLWIFACALLFRRPLTKLLIFLPEWFKDVEKVESQWANITRRQAENALLKSDAIQRPLAVSTAGPAPAANSDTTAGMTPALTAVAEQIKADLSKVPPQDQQSALIRALAFAQTTRAFEAVFADIFNSQIGFIRLIGQRGILTLKEAIDFFETKAIPVNEKVLGDYGFGRWIGFLHTNGLVDVSDQTVRITSLGSDFISFMDAVKAGYHKPL